MNPSNLTAPLLHGLSSAADYLSRHSAVTSVVVSLLALAVLALDFTLPPYVEFSILYAILIATATQFAGGWLGLALAFCLPVAHILLYTLTGNQPYSLAIEFANVFLLWLAGLATVYLLHLARRMQELRQANLRLETLQQTMVTVNDIVLNRLQVMQFMIHLAEQGKPLTADQIYLGKSALDEVAVKLRHLSHISRYETMEVTSGVQAVRVPDVTVTADPAQSLP
jgi:hypothetical protein